MIQQIRRHGNQMVLEAHRDQSLLLSLACNVATVTEYAETLDLDLDHVARL